MERIGLLGGTSWPSTIEYYRLLNEKAQAHFGEGHSARLLLSSMDYFEIRQHYPEGWDNIYPILQRELQYLNDLNPSCILICNNTLHQAYDAIKDELNLSVPVFHMADLTAQYLHQQGHKKVLLTGTQYTMESGYYSDKIAAYGIEVMVPVLEERVLMQSMQQSIAKGHATEQFSAAFEAILANYTNCDAVITACTELPLVITSNITPLVIVDPMAIQCEAAFKFACAIPNQG
ncbi:aspartate/glutamate racemase family protein [Shewanella sp. SR44-3]|uniref:aspartate/glutamate racemase family protein n=1 Tax=unclassified Shewanella TaxID=196818 RepID=UPI0015FCE491|nr:amino acid racemase [Shewanella sp. SR44-3]MBB1269902.1 aspartate/glutamate racemase family protein [Shewanella sp. SR44-3]